jgi:dipeptidyl aminopeptidase/acylaminoacyl peptidase
VRTPTLILHGEKDERVTLPQGQEMYRALKRMGVETEFVTYPRELHSIGERAHQIDLLERVLSWFDRYVKGE